MTICRVTVRRGRRQIRNGSQITRQEIAQRRCATGYYCADTPVASLVVSESSHNAHFGTFAPSIISVAGIV